jgi:hypothetical protein
LSCASSRTQGVNTSVDNQTLDLEKLPEVAKGKLRIVHSGHRVVNDEKAFVLIRLEIGDISRERVLNASFGMSADIYMPSKNINHWDLTVVRRSNKKNNFPGSKVKKVVNKNKLPFPFFTLSSEELSQIEFFNVYVDNSISVYLHPIDPARRDDFNKLTDLLKHLSRLVNGTSV